MALQKTIKKTVSGVEVAFKDAYIVVAGVNLDKINMTISVITYTNSKKQNVITNEDFTFGYNINGNNPLIQGYEYLKTLEEYADAEDC